MALSESTTDSTTLAAQIVALELAHPRVNVGAWHDMDTAEAIRKAFARLGYDLDVAGDGTLWARRAGVKAQLRDLREQLDAAESARDSAVTMWRCRVCDVGGVADADGAYLAHFRSPAHEATRIARVMATRGAA